MVQNTREDSKINIRNANKMQETLFVVCGWIVRYEYRKFRNSKCYHYYSNNNAPKIETNFSFYTIQTVC